MMFLSDLLHQTVDNLRHEKQLWKWSTWRSAARILLGRGGLLRGNVAGWRSYLRADFHPAEQDSSLSERWLTENREQYVPVGGAAPQEAALAAS
jgi:predicted metal-dependent hydrolase